MPNKDKKKVERFLEKTAADLPPEAQERYQEFRGRRGQELKLWQKWDQGGRQSQDLQPLLKSLDPLIKSETNKRLTGLGGSIPRSALHNELRNAAIRGVQTYNPARGTQLSTHLVTNFQRITDFVAANRNEKYMPREDVESYQGFQNAKQELMEELGREPTTAELQSRLKGWTPKKIKKMVRGFGPEVYTDMGTEFESPAAGLTPHDAYQLVKSTLKPEEREFAERHFPAEGAPMSIANIAKQLRISPHKAYRLKAQVESRLAPILKSE